MPIKRGEWAAHSYPIGENILQLIISRKKTKETNL